MVKFENLLYSIAVGMALVAGSQTANADELRSARSEYSEAAGCLVNISSTTWLNPGLIGRISIVKDGDNESIEIKGPRVDTKIGVPKGRGVFEVDRILRTFTSACGNASFFKAANTVWLNLDHVEQLTISNKGAKSSAVYRGPVYSSGEVGEIQEVYGTYEELQAVANNMSDKNKRNKALGF